MLVPEHPRQAGVPERHPDASHVEGAELLANESRSVLWSHGFNDDEIDEWALTYIAEERSGDVESFVAWMTANERGGRSRSK